MLRGLLAGQPFHFEGTHFTVIPTDFMTPPAPVQRPHVPIWAVGGWPSRVSMRRAALADGWLPNLASKGGPPGSPTPGMIREGIAAVREVRAAEGLPMDGYDVITEGVTSGADPAAARDTVAPWAEAGATWWIEGDWSVEREQVREYARRRLTAGPPR